MTPVETAFSANGILAKVLDGYSPRQPQIDMALEVEQAIGNQTSLVAEAGTGTGKTFAYLIPALLSEKKVILGCIRRGLYITVLYKQTSSTVAGEFLGRLVLGEEDEDVKVFGATIF